jgi:hypothetical protein
MVTLSRLRLFGGESARGYLCAAVMGSFDGCAATLRPSKNTVTAEIMRPMAITIILEA